MIARHDGGQFCHVELELAYVEPDAGGKSLSFSSNPDTHGTRFSRIDFGQPEWEAVDIKADAKQAENIRVWCELNSHRGYDFAAIAGFMLPAFHGSASHLMCSEACLSALEYQIGVVAGRPDTVSPNALYQIAKEQLQP